MTATDGTNTVKVEGSGIDAGNTEIKNVAAGTTNTSAVNKSKWMMLLIKLQVMQRTSPVVMILPL